MRKVKRGVLAAGVALLLAVAALALGGCANIGYYLQSAGGHLRLMNAARPVPEWLADAAAPDALKTKLELTQRIRSFAVAELHLPDNSSYRRYADLHRAAAVYNVVAAPVDSLTLKTWCFPVTGCVGYHGWFDEATALAEAESLRAQGLEASVYGVPAYSTLGWFNWMGGDPLLNTFIGYPEGELARIIFHELAHQVVYARDDTSFNESFATSVERLGGDRWLAQAGDRPRQEYMQFNGRRVQFRALLLKTRQALSAIYADKAAGQAQVLARKAVAMAGMRAQYAALKVEWGGFAGYDVFFSRLNNATLGAQAAYDDLVPGFEALFEREGRDWPKFYAAVRRLAELPKDERHAALGMPKP